MGLFRMSPNFEKSMPYSYEIYGSYYTANSIAV
jgi:hypothetical protein